MSANTINTLVIGGTGFIGQNLVRVLCQTLSRKITVIGRQSEPIGLLPDGVLYLQCPIGNRSFLEDVFKNKDEVIDLAYSTTPKASFIDPMNDMLDNLPIKLIYFELALQENVKKYVLISSGGTVYGDSLCSQIDENQPTNPISPYGITKLMLEKYGYLYNQIKSLPLIIVRPSNPYGPGQIGHKGQGLIATALSAAYLRIPLSLYGSQDIVRDYIYIDDLALGIHAIICHAKIGEIYNIGTSHGYSNSEIVDYINSCISQDKLSLDINNQVRRPFDVVSNVLCTKKLFTATGWHANTSIVDGISKTWAWYKKSHE